jgi:hypothetical protein
MDDLTITASTGKRIAALVAAASLLVNVAGWAGSQMVNYSQLRARVDSIAEGGSVALQTHTKESMGKFVDQEKRLTRLETIEEQNLARLSNIERDVKEVLRELRKK